MERGIAEGETRRWGWLWAIVAESREGRGRRRQTLPRERLLKAFELTGSSLDPDLLGPPQFGEDGSAQALLSRGTGLVSWTRWLSETFHPAHWIYGVGFGEIDVHGTAGAAEVRGEALDRARSALWEARRQRRHALVQGPGGAEEQALSSLLEMMAELRGSWTARQTQIVRLARVAKGRTVAARLGVGPSVVSESLSAASFRSLCRAEQAVAALGDCFGSAAAPLPLPSHFPAITEATEEPPALRAAAARQ